jgi:hypothetical protein
MDGEHSIEALVTRNDIIILANLFWQTWAQPTDASTCPAKKSADDECASRHPGYPEKIYDIITKQQQLATRE